MRTFRDAMTFAMIAIAVGCGSGDGDEAPTDNSVVPSAETAPSDSAEKPIAVKGNTEPPLPEVSHAVESVPEADATDSAITLQTVSPAEFQTVLDSHKGSVVLVDFWATWCKPCIAGLPHTTKLAHQHAGDGLVVLTMCMADGTDAEETELALSKLKENHVNLENYACTLGGGDESFDAYNIGESGLPHYKLYDRSGKLARELRNDVAAGVAVSATDVDQYVEKLLSE